MKPSSKQLEHRDLHPKSLLREANNNRLNYNERFTLRINMTRKLFEGARNSSQHFSLSGEKKGEERSFPHTCPIPQVIRPEFF